MARRYSEATVRDYVERELERTIRVTHHEFRIRQGSRWTEDTTDLKSQRLLWTIEAPSRFGLADYIIEIRMPDRELLIWFGVSSAGPPSTQHLMRPAVHLSLDDLTLTSSRVPDEFSLGAVLEQMFQSQDDEPGMRFPMNYRALT